MVPALSLSEYLSALPNPRSPLGRRHPLPAVLGLLFVAIFCGARSLEAVAQLARDRGPGFIAALGFNRRETPCKATLSNLLRRLDVDALERALSAWVASRLGPDEAREIALDGKALRGSADGSLPGVHLLAAYAQSAGAVLAQLRVDRETNEHQAALELLGVLPLSGAVVTADAMFTHADFAAKVLAGGGDYLLPVKDNQPRLLADVILAFETSAALPPPPRQRRILESDRRTARSSDKGHGRRGKRALVSTTILSGYAGWPGLAQVFRLTRERAVGGKVTTEVACGITSLPRDRADAARLLGQVRRHWGIENRLHYVRDVTMGKDACRVRSGTSPQVLAGLKNAAMHLPR